MVSTKSVALFALVAMAGASSAFADKGGEASESGKIMKSPKMKLDKHAAKGEAGEALKAKPAKVHAKAAKGGEAGEALKAKPAKVWRSRVSVT